MSILLINKSYKIYTGQCKVDKGDEGVCSHPL